MNVDINTYAIYGILILPLIIGLVQIFKKAGLPTAACSFAALGLGIAAGLVGQGFTAEGWIIGIYLGVGAAGAYDAGKTVVQLLGINIGNTSE